MATTVGLISLGCSKNRVDSEQMLAVLKEHGYQIVSDPSRAEVIIVNTCGFIQSAKEEAISTLFEMAGYKQTGCCRLLVATGCFAQRYPEAIREEMPEVDVIMGVNDYQKLDEALREAEKGGRPVYTDDDGQFHEFGRVLTTPEVQRIRPHWRGLRQLVFLLRDSDDPRRVSQPPEGGYSGRGENAGSAGREGVHADRAGHDALRHGQRRREPAAAAYRGDCRDSRRGMAARAVLLSGARGRAAAGYDEAPANVCDYLDLPMQHISQHILTDMNRTDTSAHIREVCRMFKERGMMLRTTLMVGFPGETDEDFNELMDFVKQTKFDRMGAFMFCPEDGTRAAEMPNQIPEEVKQERYDRLMTLQHGISLAQNKARVGTTCRVLVEKKRGSRYVGRSEYEAPETDGSIFFGSDEPCEIGSFVNVKITGAKAYDLMGERI